MGVPRNWDNGKTMSSLPLVFDAPRRGLPPRHLADMSPEQRAEAVAALGDKPLRARQLSHHYFGRLSVDAAGMSGGWPAVSRDRSALGGACSWLAIHAAPSTASASCKYAAVVAPSYSTTSRRLP